MYDLRLIVHTFRIFVIKSYNAEFVNLNYLFAYTKNVLKNKTVSINFVANISSSTVVVNHVLVGVRGSLNTRMSVNVTFIR